MPCACDTTTRNNAGMPCACDAKTCSNAGMRCACDVTSRRRVAAPTKTCMPAYPQSAPRQRRHTHTRRLRMSNLLETLPRPAVRHHGTSRRAGSTLRCCTRRHPQQQHVFVWGCVCLCHVLFVSAARANDANADWCTEGEEVSWQIEAG